MAYTRPAYNAANVTWVGASAYTRPSYAAADVVWADSAPQQLTIAVAGQTPTAAIGNASTATQKDISLQGQQPSIALGKAISAVQGAISIQGQNPKSFTDTFKRAPIQGTISEQGNTPTVAQGRAVTPTQRAIALQGQLPTLGINTITPIFVTGRGFTQTPEILAAFEYADTVTGAGFTQTPQLYGGAIATGYGFTQAPVITYSTAETAYITGRGFSNTLNAVITHDFIVSVTGRSFSGSPSIFGGAEVSGQGFYSPAAISLVAPDKITVLGATFDTVPTIVAEFINSFTITGRGFVSGIAYSKITGRGFATNPVLKAAFTARFAEATVMNLVAAARDAVHAKRHDTSTHAVSRYQNFPFMHLARINGEYYGMKSDGLYLMTGDYDLVETTPVNGTIQLNEDDLGAFNSQNIPYIYLNGDDDYSVTAYVDDVQQPTFTSGFGGRRAKLARGSKGRYWYFKIEGIKALQGVEYRPEGLSRKVK